MAQAMAQAMPDINPQTGKISWTCGCGIRHAVPQAATDYKCPYGCDQSLSNEQPSSGEPMGTVQIALKSAAAPEPAKIVAAGDTAKGGTE